LATAAMHSVRWPKAFARITVGPVPVSCMVVLAHQARVGDKDGSESKDDEAKEEKEDYFLCQVVDDVEINKD